MAIELNSTIRRSEQLLSAGADDDLVLLNLKSDHYIGLDTVGRRIWDLLAAPQQVNDLCAQLSREFNGPVEQIRQDVLVFLNELEREGLIHAGEGR